MEGKLTAYSFLFTVTTLCLITFALPDNTVSKLIFLGTLSFIFALYISVQASQKKCKKISKIRSIFHGIRTSLIITLAYFLITKIPIFSQPIKFVIPDDKLAVFISALILVFVICIILTNLNYKASIEKVCFVCAGDVEDNLKKYDQYLDTTTDNINDKLDIRITN